MIWGFDMQNINNAVFDNLIDKYKAMPDRVKVITGYYHGYDVISKNKCDGMEIRCNIRGLHPIWNYSSHDYILIELDPDLGI